MAKSESIVIGGGCFWCTEALFQSLRGVEKVTSGYAGGTLKDPTYEQVSSGDTGHAEVIKIDFDPAQIDLRDLLDIFFHTHNPTTLNRQGADVGSQYRSIILTTNAEQKAVAEEYIKELDASGAFSDKIVTEVKPLETFYEAEDYHHNYFANNSKQPYCSLVISPKIAKLRQKYADKIK